MSWSLKSVGTLRAVKADVEEKFKPILERFADADAEARRNAKPALGEVPGSTHPTQHANATVIDESDEAAPGVQTRLADNEENRPREAQTEPLEGRPRPGEPIGSVDAEDERVQETSVLADGTPAAAIADPAPGAVNDDISLDEVPDKTDEDDAEDPDRTEPHAAASVGAVQGVGATTHDGDQEFQQELLAREGDTVADAQEIIMRELDRYSRIGIGAVHVEAFGHAYVEGPEIKRNLSIKVSSTTLVE